LVYKLVSLVNLANAKGMCNSEFENIKYFEAVLRDKTIFELDHPWKDWEIILIYYSVLLGAVFNGWCSQFFKYGSSILSLEAVIDFDGSFTAPLYCTC
jgi:hypothetical protein